MKLDESNFENILELIATGVHYRAIAEKYKCTYIALFRFLHIENHYTEVVKAREMAAHYMVQESETLIAQAVADANSDNPNPRMMAGAMQLAHHYRWTASMLHGRQYGQRKIMFEEEEEKAITIKIIRDGESY